MTFTPAQLAEALPKAAQHIREHGLHKKGFYRDLPSHNSSTPACAYGATAIALCCSDPIAVLDCPPLNNLFDSALADLYPNHHEGTGVVEFNDDPDTTPEQIIELLDHAAKIAHTRVIHPKD